MKKTRIRTWLFFSHLVVTILRQFKGVDLGYPKNFPIIQFFYTPHNYTPHNKVVGGILVSPCPSVCRQILCRTITWVVLLRMFWNFITRGGSLSFLTIFTFAVPELLDLIWPVPEMSASFGWFENNFLGQ